MALESLQRTRAASLAHAHEARVARLLRDADACAARNDLAGVHNALLVARSLAPDDEELGVRADAAARALAESQVDANLERAREAERAGQFDRAAEAYLRAHAGRPNDATLLVRAALALMKHGKELPRAADLARRAIQHSPRSVDAHVALAQIFLAGGLRASAVSTVEAAQKLDPTSLVVKDLMRQCKGRP
jgi:tetratricopeptide (TPR) repeat protein